jgi:hypothetical protein
MSAATRVASTIRREAPVGRCARCGAALRPAEVAGQDFGRRHLIFCEACATSLEAARHRMPRRPWWLR